MSAFLITLMFSGVLFFTLYQYTAVTEDLPSPLELEQMLDPDAGFIKQPTVIVDRSGRNVLWRYTNRVPDRECITLSAEGDQITGAVSEEMILAALSAADPGYLSRTALSDILAWGNGTEDLAVQLVNDLLLWDDRQNPHHALRGRILAAQIRARYGKVQVVEWFLNSAYFGHQIYGVEQAAQYYFGKSAKALNLAESAVLAAALQYPALNPLDAPTAAKENQQTLLEEMVRSGVISRAQAERAKARKLTFQNRMPSENQGMPDFARTVLNEAAQWIPEEVFLRGGLRVVTSLDPELQTQLQCTITTEMIRATGVETAVDPACEAARLLPRFRGEPLAEDAGLAVSAVILDPRDGVVLAMVGETSPEEKGRKSSPSVHPPGSLLTPVIYLNAFTQGAEPASLVWDVPLEEGGPSVGDLHPACTENCRYHGPVNIRTAVVNDILTPAKEIWDSRGKVRVEDTLTQLGIQLENETCQDCEVFTGSPLFSIMDAAQIFGVFANQGVLAGKPGRGAEDQIRPGMILHIEDAAGRLVLEEQPLASRIVLSQELAYLVNDVLGDEAARSSLAQKNLFDLGRPAAVKAGLISSSDSAWVVGYTPQLVTAVWSGLPGRSVEAEEKSSPEISAGIWRAMTQYATNQLPVVGWTMPEGMVQMDVCTPSGLLPTDACPVVTREIFIEGNQPVQADDLYQTVEINRETGLLASVFTPPEKIIKQVFLNIPERAAAWAEQEGLPLPPQRYDLESGDRLEEGVQITSPEIFSSVRGEEEIVGSTPQEGFVSYRIQVGKGLNPATWQQIGEEVFTPAEGSQLLSWDTTSLEDGLYALQLVVLLEEQRVEKASTVVSVDNSPPVFQLVNDLAGKEIALDDAPVILFQVAPEVPDEIQKVRFTLDNQRLSTREFPPFVHPWEPEIGRHQLRVLVVDLAGNQAGLEIEFRVLP